MNNARIFDGLRVVVQSAGMYGETFGGHVGIFAEDGSSIFGDLRWTRSGLVARTFDKPLSTHDFSPQEWERFVLAHAAELERFLRELTRLPLAQMDLFEKEG